VKSTSRILAWELLCVVFAVSAHAQTALTKPAGAIHLGIGLVRSVDAKARTLTISHQAMPSLGMAAMTMDFLVARALPLKDVKEGDTIAFVLGRNGKSDEVAIVALQNVETSSLGPCK
jgi:Cu/Ag efflux protein CusF